MRVRENWADIEAQILDIGASTTWRVFRELRVRVREVVDVDGFENCFQGCEGSELTVFLREEEATRLSPEAGAVLRARVRCGYRQGIAFSSAGECRILRKS